MHRLAATPGGWTPDADGVIFVDQTPAPIVILTAADTDVQGIARVQPTLPADFPALRVANLLQLQQQLAIDTYADTVLCQAQVVVLRLLGGRAYWSYGLEVLKETVATSGAALVVIPGDDQPDPALISQSTVPLTVTNQLWQYLRHGGPANLRHGLLWLSDALLGTAYAPPPPVPVPAVGRYDLPTALPPASPAADATSNPTLGARVGLLFYRAHYLAGNTAPIDALGTALAARGLEPVAVYVSSLQDPAVQAMVVEQLCPEQAGMAQSGPALPLALVLNTTSFAIAKLDQEPPRLDLWQRLDVPVLQVILSGGTQAQWQAHSLGLAPRDVAMNVALPEVDGRIITRAVSFKAATQRSAALETDVVTYEPVPDRVQFVAELAANWVALARTPAPQRRIALVLANYPNRDGRLANGVGLDTPASTVAILQTLAAAGYRLGPIPTDGDALMHRLTHGITNDPEGWGLRPVAQTLAVADYQRWFAQLPAVVQRAITQRWGPPVPRYPGPDGGFAIAGWQCGQVFVAIQPSRGYDADPSLNYHAPDLEPPHDYLAVYQWLRQEFGVQAVVHVGKHGNLEWLPGKGVGLSAGCFPEVALGPLPHLYPFIVNDPGEGAQAKRRAQAVIIDHLTPPLTRAELYGPLQQVEGLVDEYYEAQSLDPSRLGGIGDRICALLTRTHLLQDLAAEASPAPASSLPDPDPTDLATLLPTLDGYLCQLKEAQIRDGLHIFGRCPTGRQLRDLAIAIARAPGPGRLGITRAIAAAWDLAWDPLTTDLALPLADPRPPVLATCRTVGDGVAALEAVAMALVAGVMDGPGDGLIDPPTLERSIHHSAHSTGNPSDRSTDHSMDDSKDFSADCHPSSLTATALARLRAHPQLKPDLDWIGQVLLPRLHQTPQELTHLLRGLAGRYVPSGPAGAPTRNRPDVLPTGRNFFAVDIRAIPTESAWDVGRRAAETLVERYTQDHGDYPQTLGLSVWGTATMRTGGDDLAQALALLGVRPVWDGPSRRVVDFEILPVSALGRPRVDVTLRISGFFRDAFANLIDLFDQAVAAVAALDEPAEANPLAARCRQEAAQLQNQGVPTDAAQAQARYRVFGSKPGAYGAGLQGLIDAQNWNGDDDLACAYLNWSSYAYGRGTDGVAAPAAFRQRLTHMQVVLHNQDNREHDLLDSDDYYQFQGGMAVAARTLQGQSPTLYFGDHAQPENPQVRPLAAEVARVYRSRVVNPKWIAGAMRHGYKGAFELAATVDYLFAYDATARCVADHMYQGVAAAYVLDPVVQDFVQQVNPWALRDMAERLLEAHQRGLWAEVADSTLDQLRYVAHAAEGVIEQASGELPTA